VINICVDKVCGSTSKHLLHECGSVRGPLAQFNVALAQRRSGRRRGRRGSGTSVELFENPLEIGESVEEVGWQIGGVNAFRPP